MDILVIGDLHFKVNNIKETEIFTESLKSFTKHKYDIIVLLGDLLDSHSSIHLSPFYRITKLLEYLITVCDLVFIIVGNHDRPNNKEFLTDQHPFNSFKMWEKVRVVDKPMVYGDILLVPYVPNGTFSTAIENINLGNIRLCFCHQEFRGSSLKGKITSTNGDIWPEDNPMVISGHLHDYHRPQNNIIYTGAPYQQDFSESEDKSISLVHLGDDITEERIYIPIIIKKTIELTIDEYKKFTLKKEPNVLYRIRIYGEKKEIESILGKPEKSPDVKIVFSTKISRSKLQMKTRDILDLLTSKARGDWYQEKWIYNLFGKRVKLL